MNDVSAPTSGGILSRPCSLGSIRPSLQALKGKANNAGGLTSTQSYLFRQLAEAWQYYRLSQPAGFRGEMDTLVQSIESLPVVSK